MTDRSNLLEKKYRAEADGLASAPAGYSGRVTWECPSNIALIKYWGKKAIQKPINPSLSFTLQKSVTSLSVDFLVHKADHELTLEFLLEDRPHPLFAERLMKYLQHVSQFMPFLKSMHLKMQSRSSFPHSAGIASSASSFGAIALALCSMEQKLFGNLRSENDFFRKASFLARLGSGSACRSVYGGCALWGITPEFEGSTDEAAIPVTDAINPLYANYRDSILVVSSGLKSVSSTTGHKLMEEHPFAAARVIQANHNMARIKQSLIVGDQHAFINLIEHEALTLHGLMLSSDPGFILIQPDTLEIIRKVRYYRKETGTPVGFTLDAGANVHLLYPANNEKDIHGFIEENLKRHCENGLVIHDQVGSGPVKIL